MYVRKNVDKVWVTCANTVILFTDNIDTRPFSSIFTLKGRPNIPIIRLHTKVSTRRYFRRWIWTVLRNGTAPNPETKSPCQLPLALAPMRFGGTVASRFSGRVSTRFQRPGTAPASRWPHIARRTFFATGRASLVEPDGFQENGGQGARLFTVRRGSGASVPEPNTVPGFRPQGVTGAGLALQTGCDFWFAARGCQNVVDGLLDRTASVPVQTGNGAVFERRL
mgnify:CR=1 FL=1